MYKPTYNLKPTTSNLALGFTLVELLVVIAIIGILASVTMASLGGARERARDSERISEVGQIVVALELFYDACKRYPPAPLTETYVCPTNSSIEFRKFISSVPTDPNGTAYGYGVGGTNNDTFVVQAKLETAAAALTDDLDTVPTGLTLTGGCGDTAPNIYYCKGS